MCVQQRNVNGHDGQESKYRNEKEVYEKHVTFDMRK